MAKARTKSKSMLGGAAGMAALGVAAAAAYGLARRGMRQRSGGVTKPVQRDRMATADKVDRESEQSFPASDSPANY